MDAKHRRARAKNRIRGAKTPPHKTPKQRFPRGENATTVPGAKAPPLSIACYLSREYGGKSGTGYVLSTDPRAYEQFGTTTYRGRRFVCSRAQFLGRFGWTKLTTSTRVDTRSDAFKC